MKKLFLMLFVVCLCMSGTSPMDKTTSQSGILVQLFTSQGCSSCPPADALLGKMSKKYKDKEVFFLAYHVDYWDRLGWKDPYGKKQFTQKQYDYAHAFNLNSVYTPQGVVNGKYQFTGSDREKLEQAIAKSQESGTATNKLSISLFAKAGKELKIKYKTDELNARERIYLTLYLKKQVTSVKRGENKGRELVSYNVVTAEKNTADTEGEITFELSGKKKTSDYGVLAYIQKKDKKITSVRKLNLH